MSIDSMNLKAARRAQLSDQILKTDPTQHGIPSRERFRRSQEFLRLVLNQVAACRGAGGAEGAEAGSAIARAKAHLERGRRPRSFSEAADANVELAVDLWDQRVAACRISPDNPVGFLLGKLSARGTSDAGR
jgi:hypothetical protein